MPRLLFLGYVWPEPTATAAGSRTMQLIESFDADGWDITFASAAVRAESCADLSHWHSAEVRLNSDSFDRFVEQLQPDAVLFDRYLTEEQFGWRVARTCPNALRLLDTQDLHSLRWARGERLRHRRQEDPEDDSPLTAQDNEAVFNLMATSDKAQREIASIYRCDLTLILSSAEYELLTETFGVPKALLHQSWLMPGVPPTQVPDFDQREHFVAIGNYRHPPNWDSVLWLKHRIWPDLRRRLPKAQLKVYGAYQPPKVTALHNPQQGFHVCGRAPDAYAVMARARICLAPLRFGAGVKGKLLDALTCGTPSVTTSIGVEGIQGDRHWAGAVADSAEGLVDAAVALYQDRVAWGQAQAKGWSIHQAFDPLMDRRHLMQRLENLRQNLENHRRENFIGAMLRHHQHKSTQYFSQWIEAKNRLRG